MNAETPYLMAGVIAIAGGVYREKGWPPEGAQALIGTIVLVIGASLTNNTPVAPLVRAIGFLFCLTAVMATVKYVKASPTQKGK